MTWTLEKIAAHCECTDGGCWLWQGGMMTGRYPIAKDPVDADGRQLQFYVRRRAWDLSHAKPAPAGKTTRVAVVASCDDFRCVAPAHAVLRSRSSILLQVAATGAFRTVAFRAKVAAARNAQSKLSDADVAEIRSSTEPVKQLAARMQISLTYAYGIRSGASRPDYRTPFAALVALAR